VSVTATASRPARLPAAPTRRPPRRIAPTHWRRLLLALAALLTAFAGMHVVLRDVSWWVAGAGFAALVLIATTVTRRFNRRLWMPYLVAVIVAALAVTAGFAGDRAFLGLFPTFESGDRINDVINAGWQSIQEQRVPAQPDAGIVLLLVLTMVACALFSDAAITLVKAPALMAAPLLTLLGIPVAVRADLVDALWFVITAVLYLVILRLDRRPTSGAVLALVGAVAVVGGLLTPTFLPAVQEDTGPLGGGVQTGINPLINLGDDLRRGDAVIAVTYRTDAERGVYLRLATLESFNGRSWAPNIVNNVSGNEVDDFPSAPGLGPDIGRVEQTVDVTVGDIAGRWLPLPYPTLTVEGTVGKWYWEPDGLSARSTDTGVRGQKYTATYDEVLPTLEQVSAALPHAEADLPTLDLPSRMPDEIAQIANEIAGDLPTTYERAMALQDYFTSGEFTYSEEAPVEKGYDGSGVDIIARFLEEKEGYCVHFASAMAVMARTLGIPSRVAVGFQPGEQLSVQGITSYTVSSHDLHAWPELYFDGVGWLRFEPTPGRGELPDYEGDLPVDDPATPEDEGAIPTPAATAEAGNSPERPDQAGVDPGGSASASSGPNPLPIVLGSIAGLLVLGALTPAVTRVIVRRRRESAIRSGRDPASAAWAELRDTARDYGWAAPDSETPRDFADRLAVVLTGSADAIAGFRSDVEESAFAPPGRGVPTVAELRALRRAIASTVDARDRFRAVALPESLMIRFRWDPEG
jgi:transglutaminase-like putative cysteine protease